MLCLSWKIHGYINVYRHPTTTHTSYVCNALEFYSMEYPRCQLDFHSIHTVFKLIVHILYIHVIIIMIIIILLTLFSWSVLQVMNHCFFLNIDLWLMRFLLGP